MVWPTVTVYVVNRNYGAFLSQAVDSALAQDYPAVDVVVVDDASTDGSGAILARLEGDPRVRVVRHETNLGLTASCNSAIRASSGEFLMRLDADDYLEVSAVRTMVNAITANSAAVLVFPDYFEVDARGVLIRRVLRHDFDAMDVMSDLPAHGACTLVRRTFLEEIGGYDESVKCQDGLDLWLSVGPSQKVVHVREPLFSYRQHGANLTRNEIPLLQARARLVAKHVARRGLPRPRVLAIVPVRGQIIDPVGRPLDVLGGRPLIDWTIDVALACEGVDRVVVTSPDSDVLRYVADRYPSVGNFRRDLGSAGLNVSLSDTLRDTLRAEADAGLRYDATVVLTVEWPFRSPLFVQQAIDVMQLFDTDSVISVRQEDDAFYHHRGLGLEPVRADERLRRERDDLFRWCGGIRLIRLQPDADQPDYLAAAARPPARVGHVLIDELAAMPLRTDLEWTVAQQLSCRATDPGR